MVAHDSSASPITHHPSPITHHPSPITHHTDCGKRLCSPRSRRHWHDVHMAQCCAAVASGLAAAAAAAAADAAAAAAAAPAAAAPAAAAAAPAAAHHPHLLLLQAGVDINGQPAVQMPFNPPGSYTHPLFPAKIAAVFVGFCCFLLLIRPLVSGRGSRGAYSAFVAGSGFRVWGLGFGVWGLGFRVQGVVNLYHYRETSELNVSC